MGRVFLSYRRSETTDLVGRMFEHLTARLGRENVFKDVDSIPLGRDFRKILSDAVQTCDVLIAVIGRQWVDVRDEGGARRLDDPNDFVRIEVEAALERDIPVIPVLTGGAPMPRPDELPETLRTLAFRQGTPVRSDPDFVPDIERLCRAVAAHLGLPPEPAAQTPAPAAPPRATLQETFGFSVTLEPKSGSKRVDLGEPYGRVYLDGCKFSISLTNKGAAPLVVRAMKAEAVWRDAEPVAYKKAEYPYGAILIPHQLFIELDKGGYTGWWALSLGDRLSDEPRRFARSDGDLFDSPGRPRLMFRVAPGDSEIVEGAILARERGLYDVRLMALATNAELERAAKATKVIRILKAEVE
jgi:hypothetical protein